MESVSSDTGTPPLLGFDLQGQPVSGTEVGSPADEEEEFGTPAGPEVDRIFEH